MNPAARTENPSCTNSVLPAVRTYDEEDGADGLDAARAAGGGGGVPRAERRRVPGEQAAHEARGAAEPCGQRGGARQACDTARTGRNQGRQRWAVFNRHRQK